MVGARCAQRAGCLGRACWKVCFMLQQMQHGPLKDDHKKRQCCQQAGPCSCAVRPQYVQHRPAVNGSVCPRLLNPAPTSPACGLRVQRVQVRRSGSCCRWQALRAAGADDIGHACASFDFEFHASPNVHALRCNDSSLVSFQ